MEFCRDRDRGNFNELEGQSAMCVKGVNVESRLSEYAPHHEMLRFAPA